MIRAILPLGLLFAVACGGNDDDTDVPFTQGTTTAEGVCEVLVEDALDVADVTDLGYSAEQLLRDLENVRVNTLEWVDGESDGLVMEMAYTGGQVTYYERSLSGNATAELVSECVTGLEFPVTMTFATDIGDAFDETFEVTMRTLRREEATWTITVDPGSLTGTWTPADSGIDDSAYTAGLVVIEGVSDEIGSGGTIKYHGTNADGSIAKIAVATFDPPPYI